MKGERKDKEKEKRERRRRKRKTDYSYSRALLGNYFQLRFGAKVDSHGPFDHGDSTVAVLSLVVDVLVGSSCRFFVIVC